MVDSIEQLAARCFDGVMTADPSTLRRLSRTGKSKKLVFYNFPNLDFFPAPKPSEKRFDIVYRGGLSDRAGTFVLLAAVKLLAEQRAKPPTLLLMGYPDNAEAGNELRERVRAWGSSRAQRSRAGSITKNGGDPKPGTYRRMSAARDT